jgi:hypothetical protein
VLDNYFSKVLVGMPVADAKAIDKFEVLMNSAIRAAVSATAAKFAGRIAFADTYDPSTPHNCRGTTPNATVTALELAAGDGLAIVSWLARDDATYDQLSDGISALAA